MLKSIIPHNLFYFDAIALTVSILVVAIGLIVGVYAFFYMKDESCRKHFFITLFLLIFVGVVFMSADHILLLLAAWGSGNRLFVKLMMHNPNWQAAAASARLAAKNLFLGLLFIASALFILYLETGESSVQAILSVVKSPVPSVRTALILLWLGAMVQSAVWPFHLWFLSSLNSPVPVLALMYSCMLGGGGVLLVRFSSLCYLFPELMNALFLIGIWTIILGMSWKEIQSDVRRMRACSTMAQMGLVFVHCGLGFFSLALSHICWHGCFRVFQFLWYKRPFEGERPKRIDSAKKMEYAQMLLFGAVSCAGFAVFGPSTPLTSVGGLLLQITLFFTFSQLFMLLPGNFLRGKFSALCCAFFTIGFVYGLTVRWAAVFLSLEDKFFLKPLNGFHIFGFSSLSAAWLLLLCRLWPLRPILDWLYVKALNASQPYPETITSYRNRNM